MSRQLLLFLLLHGATSASVPARLRVRSAQPSGDEKLPAPVIDGSSSEEQGHLLQDDEPMEVYAEFLNVSSAAAALRADLATTTPWPDNPKNGTPWYRLKKVSTRGKADHPHFDGLAARGDFKEDIVLAHNVVRQRVGLHALKWNERLAALSAQRVDRLAGGGCFIRHSPLSFRWDAAGFPFIGENLYKVINMNPSGVDIVDAWYAEIGDYSYGPVGSYCTRQRCASRRSPPCTLGHFTQVMWGASTDLGCARAECPGQPKTTFIAVCHYGPGGNVVGRIPFWPETAGMLGLEDQTCDYYRDKVRDAQKKYVPTPLPIAAAVADPNSHVHNSSMLPQAPSGAIERTSLSALFVLACVTLFGIA